jgi:Na+/proline symporter
MSLDTSVSRSSAPSTTEPDWTDQVTDLIVDSVDKVRDATTGRLVTVSRVTVFALAIIPVAIVLLFVGLAFAGRLLAQLPWEAWITHAGLAVLFLALGAMVWKTRHPS